MKHGKDFARYMTPPLTHGRLDRQWEGVERLTRRRSVRRWAALAVAVPAVVAALVFLAWRTPAPAPVALEGAVVETSGTSTQRLTLADGSRVELSEATLLRFATIRTDAIRLILERGALSLDVVHDPARAFTIVAGGYDVAVRGTRFRVALTETTEPTLTIAVEEGRVESYPSESAGSVRAIGAGETLTVPLRKGSTPPKAPPALEPTARAEVEPTDAPDEPSSAPSAPGPSKAPVEPSDRFAELLKEGKYREAYDALGPDGYDRQLAHAGPRQLLELADAARLGGHPREATRALDKLRRTYRSDSRAGLAALELGRLRTTFGDLRGALEAFGDAVALAPAAGSVREDAEARRVQVLEALGDVKGCARARDAYLARFPNGIHVATMRGRCSQKK